VGIGFACVAPVLAAGAAMAVLVGAPTVLADTQPTPAPPTVTATVVAPAPVPRDNQACTSSVTATKCAKAGDAEVNAAIPGPFGGVYSIYGPFWAGQGTRIKGGSGG
jgi:hypothetical protein